MWWMPWQQTTMKDVAGCEKLRGGAEQPLIRRCPNGETPLSSSIVIRGSLLCATRESLFVNRYSCDYESRIANHKSRMTRRGESRRLYLAN